MTETKEEIFRMRVKELEEREARVKKMEDMFDYMKLDMDRPEIKTTMYLNQERMQFSWGKTEKALKFAAQNYYSNYYSVSSKDHNLCLIITNNSLAETEQWKVRVGKKFNRTLNIAIFSSKVDANYNKVDTLIAALSTSLIKNLPHIIILCCHPVRITHDIPKLLEYTKKNIRVDGIRFITNLIFDEVDKTSNLNLVVKLNNKLPNYKYIQDIIWITATPLEDFWKTLRKNGINELSNIDKKIEMPDRIHLNQTYCQITDHQHCSISNRPTNPIEYINYILNHTDHIELDKRNVIFAPAENNTKSHAKMVELFNSHGFIALIHNGKHKEFRFSNGESISIKDFNIKHDINGELRDTLRKLNQLYPHTSIAITGLRTIERGITLNTNEFNFTHMIIADYHGKKLNTLLQLMGRSAGHVDFVDKMKVICSDTIWNQAVDFNKDMEALKVQNPDVYTRDDFIKFKTLKMEYEPIIIKFKDQKIAKKFYVSKIRDVLGKNSTGHRKRNKEATGENSGKYLTTIRGDTHVYSTEEILRNKGCGVNSGSLFRFSPCYIDVNDISTLEFWYIIYAGENIKEHKLYKYHNKLIERTCENW